MSVKQKQTGRYQAEQEEAGKWREPFMWTIYATYQALQEDSRVTILILFLSNKMMKNRKYKNYKRKLSLGDKH